MRSKGGPAVRLRGLIGRHLKVKKAKEIVSLVPSFPGLASPSGSWEDGGLQGGFFPGLSL